MKNFTRSLFLALPLLFGASLAMAQATYQTVGIIGSATALGWDNSTAMTPVAGNAHQWTITIPLTQAEVKFRADDAWTINWGDTAFPTGNGTQNGPNIPISAAGTYRVTFDDTNGAYNFTLATSTREASAFAGNLMVAPNPAANATTVVYELAAPAKTTVAVLNSLGQTVREFQTLRQNAGRQEQALNLNGLAAGMYLVQLRTETQVQTGRLIVK